RQEGQPMDGIGLGATAASFADQEHVSDFQAPQVRNDGGLRGKSVEHRLRIVALLVGEAPGQGDGAVDPQPVRGCGGDSLLFAQRRPSSIMSRMVIVPSVRDCRWL